MIPNMTSRCVRESMQDIKSCGTAFKPQWQGNKLIKDNRGVGRCHTVRQTLDAPCCASNRSGNFLVRIDAQIDPKQKTR